MGPGASGEDEYSEEKEVKFWVLTKEMRYLSIIGYRNEKERV